MRLFIDADGCPVVNEAVGLCRTYGVQCFIICDTSHIIKRDGVETITVEKGTDSADFKLVNTAMQGDIAVTQDYALAAMCLSRKIRVINQSGMEYNDMNIDGLLYSRYEAKKIRMAGGRLRGPSKRKPEQTRKFTETLENILKTSVK